MRKCPTIHEAILGDALMEARIKNRWQVCNQVQIGPYIADFVIDNKNIVIEVDGKGHEKRKTYDNERNLYMVSKGYTVIRFTNKEVKQNVKAVIAKIEKLCE